MQFTFKIRTALYYLRHGTEIFSDYLLPLDVTVLLWKLKKENMPSNLFLKHQIETGSAQHCEIFILIKWTYQVLLSLACSDKTKYIQVDSTALACATDEFQKSRKNAMF